MSKVRDVNIDILKGIGMLLVIIGHSGCPWPFYQAIYAFHMPLFFIVSGLFFSTKMSVWGGVKIEFRRLIASYIVICLITTGCLYLLGEHYEVFVKSALIGTTITNDYNMPLGPVWFLLALFWCRIIYRMLAEYTSIKWRTIIITSATLIVLIAKLYVWEDLYKCPWNLLQGIVCMFYYHVGVLLRDNTDRLQKIKEWNKGRKSSLLLVSFMLLVLSVGAFKKVGSNMNLSMLQTPFLPVDLLNAIGLTIALYIVICSATKHLGILNPLHEGLRWIGEHSMAIFAVHCVEYHTTIPFIRGFAGPLMERSDSFFEKGLILTVNPIVQILICIMFVWLWQEGQVLTQQKINKN